MMEPVKLPGVTGQADVRMPTKSGARTARETADEFESVFIGQMTRLMIESTEVGDEFTGGHGEEMFRGIMAEQIGKEITKHGGVGLASHVLEQIIHLQGNGNNDQ
jgi:flagellar protein FlgJ